MKHNYKLMKKSISELVPRFREDDEWVRKKDVLVIIDDSEKEQREMKRDCQIKRRRRHGKSPNSWGHGYFSGYIDAIKWVLGEDSP